MTEVELEALYDAYGARLIAFARNLVVTEDDAEDVVQRVFLRLAQSAREKPTHPRAYLFAACRNEALRFVQSRQREWERRGMIAADSLALAPTDAQDLEAAEMCRVVSDAVRRLPADQREVLHLKAFENMSFEEIADVLKVSRDTAASRYRYAMEKMSRMLAPWKDRI